MLAKPGKNICLQFRKKITRKFANPWLPMSLLGRSGAAIIIFLGIKAATPMFAKPGKNICL